MKTSTVLMTPEFARTLLKSNSINRKIRPTWVKALVEIITRGEWITTHQGIAISEKNNVIDGQHRLIAISESNIPVTVLLSTECKEETFMAVDRGVTRTIADVTHFSKKTSEVLTGLYKFINGGASSKASPQQIIAMYEKIGAEVDYVHEYAPSSKKTFTSAGVRSAVAILYKQGDKDALEIYRRLTLSEFDCLSNSMQMFVKQAIENRLAPTALALGGSGSQFYIFTKSLFCFNQKNKDRKVVIVTDEMKQAAKKSILDVLA